MTGVNPALLNVVQEQQYPLLFVTISGAHLYGFASAGSDYDLRGVHVLPVEEVIGLRPPRETIEVMRRRPPAETAGELMGGTPQVYTHLCYSVAAS